VRLLYAINLRNGSLGEPIAEGVIFQQINKGNTYTTQRDGRSYNVLERKYAMFSENSGTVQLNPIVFEGEITDNRRQSFSMFQRGKPVRQVSKMLEMNIKQIPQSFIGKPWIPADQVVLKQNWSNNKPYKVGEPITRTIELVIAGLSETQLPELEIAEFPGAKIYQDKTDTMTRTDAERLIATKTIKYAVIPTKQGTLTIPEFKLDWYDVKNKTLRTASIASSALQIEAANLSASTPIFTDNKQVLIPETDMTKNSIPQISKPEKPLWKYLTWLFASLWLITLIIWTKQTKKPVKAQQSTKEKPLHLSNKILLRELKSNDAKTIQQALVTWWNLNNSKAVSNLSQIIALIEPAETKMLLDQLQQSLYSPNQPATQNTNWPKIINNKGFKPKTKQTKTKNQGLPDLYS
ncbi:MAG: BatD family protein, partial [Proteobacteria bacterium]|nr:BatD family protein [Pseudomonadota bacterium]